MSEIMNGWQVDFEVEGRGTYSVRLVPFDGTPDKVIDEAIAAAEAEIGEFEITGASAYRVTMTADELRAAIGRKPA